MNTPEFRAALLALPLPVIVSDAGVTPSQITYGMAIVAAEREREAAAVEAMLKVLCEPDPGCWCQDGEVCVPCRMRAAYLAARRGP